MISLGYSTYAQCLIFNEIMINPDSPFDGSGMPNTAEWVEIHNLCSTAIDASCFVITDGDFTLTLPTGTIIAPDDYFTIGSMNSTVPIDLNWGTCGCTTNAGQVGIFTNSGEQLVLIDEAGQFIDGVYWGNGQFPINISSGGVGCSMQSITFANATGFTNIPYTNQQACTVSIDCNGQWAETCGNAITPNANNNIGSPQILFEASSTNICAGDCIDLTFTGSGVNAWNWSLSGSNTGSSNDENPTSICYDTPGVYDITLEIDGPCGADSYTALGLIEVSPNSAPSIATSTPLILCLGETAEILSIDGSSLNWFHDGDFVGSGASWMATESGDYWATQGSSGCDAPSNTVTLNFTPTPTPNIISNQNTACEGEEITLTATSGMDAYQWSLDGVILSQVNGNTCVGSTSGIYTLESMLNGCAGSTAIELTFLPLPVGSLSPSGAVSMCEDEISPLLCTGSFESIQWLYNGTALTNANASSVTPDASGAYTAELNTAGCIATTEPVDVTILPLPAYTWTYANNESTCVDELPLQIMTTSEVQWYLNGQIIPGATNNVLIATSNGSYTCVIDPISACSTESPACEVLLNVP
ncbi:MAG: lamin tail domain-containing protein, partial [Flavobacteriales bacterium]